MKRYDIALDTNQSTINVTEVTGDSITSHLISQPKLVGTLFF